MKNNLDPRTIAAWKVLLDSADKMLAERGENPLAPAERLQLAEKLEIRIKEAVGDSTNSSTDGISRLGITIPQTIIEFLASRRNL